jgi:four helix bundle protein
VIGYQLLRSATSIGANYREANRAESRADFIHKIALVEKEAAETQYWLELCCETQSLNCDSLDQLQRETSELLAIFTSIGKTSKGRR